MANTWFQATAHDDAYNNATVCRCLNRNTATTERMDIHNFNKRLSSSEDDVTILLIFLTFHLSSACITRLQITKRSNKMEKHKTHFAAFKKTQTKPIIWSVIFTSTHFEPHLGCLRAATCNMSWRFSVYCPDPRSVLLEFWLCSERLQNNFLIKIVAELLQLLSWGGHIIKICIWTSVWELSSDRKRPGRKTTPKRYNDD